MNRRFGRGNRAVAALTLLSLLAGMFPSRLAHAQSEPSPASQDERAVPENAHAETASVEGMPRGVQEPGKSPEVSARLPGHLPPVDPIEAPVFDREAPLAPEPRPTPSAPTPRTPTPASLPNGVDTTGVSSQVLSLPQGAGKVQGMGESFSNQLSTGTGSFSVPISLPGARGGADPTLSLGYSTSSGHGLAGVGWDIGVPFIARQTDRGSPQYVDPPAGTAWAPTQDRFVFNGGQELVPIGLVSGGSCPGAQPGEIMPSWANGWQYFRPRIEGSFLRIFWSPDHRTWRVQDKNGESMELGAPLDGTPSTGTIEANPGAPSQIFRWNLSRQYDTYGSPNPASGATPLPVNVTRYVYAVDGAMSYLTDVYDTPPAANAATADVSAYAHHARLLYAARPDATTSYRRGWAAQQNLRITGIDVTSAPFDIAAGPTRRLVRRYHLTYEPGYHVSLLSSVQVEGRCGTPAGGEAEEPVAEDGSGHLPPTTNCPMLPAMTFGYTHVTPRHSDGSAGVADLAGYEGFDERVTTMAASPPHSVDEQYTDLFDVNSDGLPDVLVTMPGLYGGKHGLYLNSSADGKANSFTATTMSVQGVLGEDATTISLDNLNISSGDIDGDGTIDLIHMPQVKTYSVYTPQGQGSTWVWQGREVTTAAAQSPKINFGSDGLDIQRMDVNGDGLVDVVVSTGTEMETFFSLDRYPGGDGQFGSATWTSATTATIWNDPVAFCVPWDGLPVQLSDGTIKIADMNGDGLPDIVRVEQGNIHYWPGRGNGYWGTGSAGACPKGTFGENQSIAMGRSPQYADPNGSALRVDDVNGDGLDDVVEVNFTEVNVWLNVDGTSWLGPHVIQNAPASPAYQSRVRLVDMNGSGTRDILWGDGGAYKFMDLSGGERPWLLTHVANGLGKTTDLSFASSVTLMLAAAAGNARWTSVTPTPIHVVSQMTVSDHLPVAGTAAGTYVTQYTYASPVYDGLQREFRGFTTARERHVGDGNSPSSSAESEFLLGACEDDEPLDGLPSACSFAGRWRDNRREALKGLPLSVQTFDDSGNYLSTVHDTYRLRKLYDGLDGREVRHAYVSATDTYLYDTWPGDHLVSSVTLAKIELELAPPVFSSSEYLNAASPIAGPEVESLTLHGTAGRVHLHAQSDVDVFGNTYHAIDSGCVEGCAQESVTQGGKDDVITQYAQPSEVSRNTGWLWRNTQTMTQGTSDAQARNLVQRTFDPFGSPLVTQSYLSGTALLPLQVLPGQRPPQPPPGNSRDGWVASLVQTYDPFGNALTSTAPNARCRATTFDSLYAALPVSDTVFVGQAAAAGCGGTALTSSATYDRGLGAVKMLTDLHLATTVLAYDGFGRIVELFRPDPRSGQAESIASMVVDYELPADPDATPYSRVHTEVQDGADPTVASYRESWAIVDGLGRTRASFGQADPLAHDRGAWVESGLTTYDGKGAKNFTYLDSFYDADPGVFNLSSPAPSAPYTRVVYDAFGRAFQSYALDQTLVLESHYHALSVDAWDAEDLGPGLHAGSFATSAKDGHGRASSVTERNHVNGVLQSYETATAYLSTGEPRLITRTNETTGATVQRSMAYDTLGRMTQNREPDTSSLPTRFWRYAYNDNGDLVGMEDARGCGADYAYDAGGRIVGEDYVPCSTDQAPYSPITATTGYEVVYRYDAPDADAAPAVIPSFPDVNPPWFKGRLSSVTDRSGKTVNAYDGRGRTTGVARRLVGPSGALAPRWYVQLSTYDAADRQIRSSTGAADSGATALDVTSAVYTTFTKRSLIRSVDSGPGGVIADTTHDADGLPTRIVYGDAVSTTTAMTYTGRRQIYRAQTARASAPASSPLVLQDLTYTYDRVDNPLEIDDGRLAREWPVGAQPVSRAMKYDDLYRLTEIDYQQAGGNDPWTSPFAAEDQGVDPDPQRSTPVPHQSFASRINQQTFAYDWLGNTTSTNDDANGFYDRSLGTITNGTATAGPYQLQSASLAAVSFGNDGFGGVNFLGNLTVAYDTAGNMTSMSVSRTGTCLPVGAVCSHRFAYSWDEVGRLVRARRWDQATPGVASSALPTTVPAADLRYTYDATDDRATKAAYDAAGNVRYALYPLDALELRGTSWDTAGGDYARSAETQAAYVFAHGMRLGRIVPAKADEPATAAPEHLFLELGDHLGSTSTVIDDWTGELVEEATYQAYGGADSDYRPERWDSFREDYRFTGKEEDVEVGLEYFGKRYFAPGLGRWVSADPLAVHSPGDADLNTYAYVHGRPLRATDPTGLQEAPSAENSSNQRAAELFAEHDTEKRQRFKTQLEEAQGRGATMALAGAGCLLLPTACKAISLAAAFFNPESADYWLAFEASGELGAAGEAEEGEFLATSSRSESGVGQNESLPPAKAAPEAPGVQTEVPPARATPAPTGASAPTPQRGCFVAGTVVVTSDGNVPIESVRVGDLVLARDAETGETTYHRVEETYVHSVSSVEDVAIEDDAGHEDRVTTTSEHPFWVNGRGWVSAGDLQVGDELSSATGRPLTVRSLAARAAEVEVFNFTVESVHSYFVGESGTWVHNTCPGGKPPTGPGSVPKAAEGRVTGDALAAARKEFEAVKPDRWKFEAATNAEKYSAEQVADMAKGKGPVGSDGYRMELHHGTPLAEGGSNAFDNLMPLTRTDHRLGPNYKINHPNLP